MRRATAFARPKQYGVSISIHALHEESDACRVFTVNARRISIHALHEESDLVQDHGWQREYDFNPRSP